jgi:hypothetical protein
MSKVVWKHLIGQIFVVTAGAAALVHSAWSLGTLFSGTQPKDPVALIGWLIPALLIAFSIDVGQISTSAEIREHGLTWARGVTFAVFALATYYLQWLYIAHHMPAMTLAAGVRAEWSDLVTLIRDSAMWFIPALLPLSTVLYTFSGRTPHKAAPLPAEQPAPVVVVEAPPAPAELPPVVEEAPIAPPRKKRVSKVEPTVLMQAMF